MSQQRVLVTGATGFIGHYICDQVAQAGFEVRKAVRSDQPDDPAAVRVGDIDSRTDWTAALAGVDCVIHLAARVHVMQETAADPLEQFREVNTRGTLRLAQACAERRVRRLIYISTIGVNGQSTPIDQQFSEDSAPAPHNPYGQSKWEAEQGLEQIRIETSLETVIIRPPLVYGPDAPGNFAQLIRWAARGIPLPLGGTNNLRSLVFVKNLADFIVRSVTEPGAKNQLFLISDGNDLSTTALLRQLSTDLRARSVLIPIPAWAVELPLRAIKREKIVEQLWGSLRINSSKARTALNWQPPYSTQAGLRWTAEQYTKTH